MAASLAILRCHRCLSLANSDSTLYIRRFACIAFLSAKKLPTSTARFAVHPSSIRTSRNIATHAMEGFLTENYFVNNTWTKASANFPVYNPYNGKKLGDAANCTAQDTEAAIDAASAAFQQWQHTCGKERSKVLKKWGELIIANKQPLAELITAENGKPINESLGEIQYAASFLEWCAEEAKRSYGMTIPHTQTNKRMMSIKQPVGVAAMVTPWNFPSAMITRKAGAAIAAGCTVVLKPAEDTPFSALGLAKLSVEAGLPAGVYNVLPSSRENAQQVGQAMCESSKVAAMSFTGSTATGKILLRQSACTVKKVGLELGGLAPFIVFDSADVTRAVKNAMACKFRYSGQTCVCANRIYVQEGIHDEFVRCFQQSIEAELKLGDPMDTTVTFGPLINGKAVDKVDDQLNDALKHGAKLIMGGKRSSLGCNFYEPTLITDVTRSMKCTNEETFGPIAPIIKFKTEEEVVALANDTRVGLAGYFFSNDVAQCWRVAEGLQVGMVGINEGLISAAEAPFGGFKESGLGREGSSYALDEYMETKYLCWGI